MHQAGLDGRVREGRLDRLREAGQPVDAEEQDVGDAAGLQIGQDVQPELRAFGLLEPQAEDVTLAVEVDAQRHVARLVSDRMPVADLHDQRVEVDDRVDALKRPVLPRLRVGQDRVGDLRDQVRRDLGAIDLGQCAWISRTVRPRAYRLITRSSNPTHRVWRFLTICGSNVPLRSRGEWIRSGP